MLASFFYSGPFMPHGGCYLWTQSLIALHVASDALIVLSYYSIPFTLLYFVRRRKDLKFDWMFVCFAVFILACGTSHLMEIWNVWHGNYWFSGIVKAVTALVSVPTAILLVRLVPAALALPGPGALQKAYAQADVRLQEGTADLLRTTKSLEAEILERKRAEEQLKISIKEIGGLKAALDEHAIVAITDPQGQITYVNDKFCSISKYSRQELLGQDHRIINSGCHSKEFIRGIWHTIANGRVWKGEIKNKAKDGTFYWVDTTIVPFLNEDGKPRQYVAIRADITEKKRAEEQTAQALRELNDVKAALDEHAIVAITDPRGKITYVNDKFCEISKYSREELIGQDHRIINSGFHPKEFIRNLWQTIGAGSVWKGEIKNKAKDESFYWVDTTIVPYLGKDGKPTQYVAIRADITERKRAEEQIAQTLRELNDVKVALDEHAIVAITDPRGKITYVNDKFCAISKYSRGELMGQDHRIINSGFHPKEFIREIWITIGSGRVWKGEIKNKAKDGTFYWVDTTIVPYLGEDGKPTQFIAIRADITTRKQAEEREAWLASFPERNPNPITEVDLASGVIHYANSSTMRAFPELRLQGLQHPWFQALSSIAEALVGGREESVRREVSSNGTIFEQVINYIPESRRLRLYGTDITRRKQAESVSAQLVAIVQFSNDAIVGKDLQGIISSWNAGAVKTFGFSAQEMIGQSIIKLIPPDRLEEEREILSRILNGESVQHFETLRLRKDGKLISVSVTVSPIRDSSGRIVGASKVARDITERKNAQEALRQQAMLFDQLYDPAIVWEWAGPITFWNHGAERLYGFPKEVALGNASHELLRTRFPRSLQRCLATLEKNGQWVGELEHTTRDGRKITVESRMTLVRESERTYVLEANRDITERQRAETALRESHENLERNVAERTAQLQLAKERAEEAGRAKSEFMASMSHELRTPLNGIIGFSEFLVDGRPGPLNSKQKEFLDDILNSGRHLLQLINDVLDLAKVEAGKIEFFPEKFLLHKAISEVCSVAGPIAVKKNIQVALTIAPGLVEVTLDQMRFKQVVYNLLSNALKFTEDGGRVEIQCMPIGSHQFQLAVKDNGIGIKPEDLSRLFKEFEQVDSGMQRRHDGTGLGLALTRKMLEMQGGSIKVESILGKGSTFSALLPLVHAGGAK